MSMAAMAAKAKAMTLSAGDATARQAKATKLKGEIMLLEREITALKKDFGLLVYDQMVAANRPEVERLFSETKAKIEEKEAKIAQKRQHVDELKVPTTPRDSGGGGDPSAWAPPPPGPPPPGGGPGLPPGWKRTQTAEGREYCAPEPLEPNSRGQLLLCSTDGDSAADRLSWFALAPLCRLPRSHRRDVLDGSRGVNLREKATTNGESSVLAAQTHAHARTGVHTVWLLSD